MSSQHQFCPEEFSLAAEEAVDEVCRSFEAALRRGELPSIQSELAKVERSLRPLALYELVKLDVESQVEQARQPRREDYQKFIDSDETASAVETALSECTQRPSQFSDSAAAPGQDAQNPSADANNSPVSLPKKLGRYVIQLRLGQGGMGAVFKAFDTRLQRYVALKVPHYDQSSDSRIRKRFRREALALASLRHDMIVPVYDVERDGDYEFLTMALVEGEPLRRYVQPEQPVAARHAAVLVRALAKAMQYVHDRGVIHRDLKPENIILEGGRKPVIVDFGLARAPAATEAPPADAPGAEAAAQFGKSLTRFGLVAGTPDYSSPEQLAGDFEAVGPRSDVYSLGVILFELLTGKLPWDDKHLAQNDAAIGRLAPKLASDLNHHVDPRLARICARAIDPSPENRPQSMDEFADALKPFCAGHAVHHRLAVGGDAAGNENLDAALVLQEITRRAEPRFSRPAPRRLPSSRRRTLAYRVGGTAVLIVLVAGGVMSVAEWRPVGGQSEPVASVNRQNSLPSAMVPDWKSLVREKTGGAGLGAASLSGEQGAGPPPAWDMSLRRLIEAGAAMTFEIPGVSGRQQSATVRDVGTIPQRSDCRITGVQLAAGSLDSALSADLQHVLQRYQASIRELEMRGVQLDEATLEVIAQLTELEVLNLAESNLQDQSIPLLGRLPQLKHVDLSATGLSDDAVDDLIHACRELKELRSMDLRATKISQPAARALQRRLKGQQVAVRVLY